MEIRFVKVLLIVISASQQYFVQYNIIYCKAIKNIVLLFIVKSFTILKIYYKSAWSINGQYDFTFNTFLTSQHRLPYLVINSGLLNEILWSQYIVQYIKLFNTMLYIVKQKKGIVNQLKRLMINTTYQITA